MNRREIKSIMIKREYTVVLMLCVSKCLSEEAEGSNLIREGSLFDVTGYPLPGDIPLLNRKIFRGTRVKVREHPYIVSVRRNGAHYLTGTLITKNLVLTVAHPIAGVPVHELRIVAGENYCDRGTSLLTVIIVIIHEDFDPLTLAADICMLRFFEDVIFRSSVKSIPLVTPHMQLSGTAFVTGWGRCDFTGNELCLPRSSQYYPDEKADPMLRSVPVTITSQNVYCEGYKLHGTAVGEGMVCAGGAREENPAYPCLGVPGAPLVLQAKLAGVLSWGFGCGAAHDLPLVYTSTQHYTSWITHNIVIFRRLSKDDFISLFQATKSYVIIEWLSRTRVSVPLPHVHPHTIREIQLMENDEELIKLQGSLYDIRDFVYQKKYHGKKVLLYAEMKKALLENITKMETIQNASKSLKLKSKARPFLSHKSLLDITVTSENEANSDDD